MTGRGNLAKQMRYLRLVRVGNQWMIIPTRNRRNTPRWETHCFQMLPCQADPMELTILVAILHAVSLATAGFRLEPERKKRRVKVMKVKVTPMLHALSTQGNSRVVKEVHPKRIQALTKMKAEKAKSKFHRGSGKRQARTDSTTVTRVLQSARRRSDISRQNL